MVRYLAPQLKRTYDRVLRTLMPWRMIDALETLDEADRQRKGGAGVRDVREEQIGQDTAASPPRPTSDGSDQGRAS